MLAKKEEMTKSNEVFVKQAASAGINRIRNLFLPIGKYLPAIGTYYSVYKSGVDGQLNNKEKRELENFRENQELLKQKINNFEEVSAVDKAKYSSMANQISERASPLPLIKDTPTPDNFVSRVGDRGESVKISLFFSYYYLNL